VAGEQWEDSRMGLTDPAMVEPAPIAGPVAAATGQPTDGGDGC
jgi:hypothetical protein